MIGNNLTISFESRRDFMAWICIGRLLPDCIRSVRRSVQNGSQSSYIQITSRSHHLPPPPGPPCLPCLPRPRPRPRPSQPPRPHHPSQPPYLPPPPPPFPRSFQKRSILDGGLFGKLVLQVLLIQCSYRSSVTMTTHVSLFLCPLVSRKNVQCSIDVTRYNGVTFNVKDGE